MVQLEIVECIFDVVEQLFVEKGFVEILLCLIISKVGVNLVVVNYYFGLKKVLIQVVFLCFFGLFCVSLEKELDCCQVKFEVQYVILEDFLYLLVFQVMVVKLCSGNDLLIFMCLFGLVFSQSQGYLCKYLEEVYGKVFWCYMLLVNEVVLKLLFIELFWCVYFMFGVVVFSMLGIKVLWVMVEIDFGVNIFIEQVMYLMVLFFVVGMCVESGIDDLLLVGV